MAERYVQVLLQTELNATASAAYQAAINDVMLDKMLDLVAVGRSPRGGYQALITAPDFLEAEDLTKYQGETPSNYIAGWINELRAITADLPGGGALLMLPIPPEGNWTERDRESFRAWLWGQSGMEEWLRRGIEQSGLYKALSRLIFFMPEEQSGFARRFVRRAQAPQYPTGKTEFKRMVRGHRGENVEAAQRVLIAQGYLPEGEATGTFTREMQSAVRQFQRDNGLTEDGILDSKTQTMLFVEGEGVTIRDVLADNGISEADFELWWLPFVRSMYDIEWTTKDPGMPILTYQTMNYGELTAKAAAELIRAAESGRFNANGLNEALYDKIYELTGKMERSEREEMRLALPCGSDVMPKNLIETIGAPWMEDNFRRFLEAVDAARSTVTQNMDW